jgi:hypothetical protein
MFRLLLSLMQLRAVKAPELEALSDAVQAENRRLFALEAQTRCLS